jgi:serine/threonine-protein kinase
MTLKTDQILIHRYRVIELLARGGMGSVYHAYDLSLDREVAIKQLLINPIIGERALEQIRDQFQREARILASLDHPNLPRVTDHFTEDDLEYLVMDFVAGRSLSEIVEESESPLTEAQVLEWADQLLSALEYIHHRGVIHRDIKPSNIRLTPNGKIFLVDFGLVKLYTPDNPKTATISHGLGTPEYAPPEQYDARLGHTDPRSDIYALGATLYHLLTGQAPPTATQQISDPDSFQRPRALSPRVSITTERLILRAMELPRSRRFASAIDMRTAVRLARNRKTSDTPTTRLPVWVAVERRISARGLALAAFVVVVVTGGIIGLASGRFSAAPTATPPATVPATTILSPTLTPTVFAQVILTPTATATATSTPTATGTSRPTPTPTPTQTSTFTPTATATRRATFTPTPTPVSPTARATSTPPPPKDPTAIPTRVPTLTPIPPTPTDEPTPIPPTDTRQPP